MQIKASRNWHHLNGNVFARRKMCIQLREGVGEERGYQGMEGIVSQGKWGINSWHLI